MTSIPQDPSPTEASVPQGQHEQGEQVAPAGTGGPLAVGTPVIGPAAGAPAAAGPHPQGPAPIRNSVQAVVAWIVLSVIGGILTVAGWSLNDVNYWSGETEIHPMFYIGLVVLAGAQIALFIAAHAAAQNIDRTARLVLGRNVGDL